MLALGSATCAADSPARATAAKEKIQALLQDAKEELVPFLSDLNDISKLLDSELNPNTVKSSSTLIRQANWKGGDGQDALLDVEKELDRGAADLAKYE